MRCEAAEAAHTSRGRAAAAADALGFGGEPIRLDGQTKYCVVARGEAQLFTRLPRRGYRERIWDHAAGALLVEEAGGRVSDLNGDALDFSEGAMCHSGRRSGRTTDDGHIRHLLTVATKSSRHRAL